MIHFQVICHVISIVSMYSIILGMNWLVKYKAQLDCAGKTVTVTHPSGDIVQYRSPLAMPSTSCLLYTSDAADEEDSVDLGGRRIIKKKKKKIKKIIIK